MKSPKKDRKCPDCQGRMEAGFLQAQGAGIMWTIHPDLKWTTILSKKWVKLQRDWWGFPKLAKDKLPGFRCKKCKLVVFRYTGD